NARTSSYVRVGRSYTYSCRTGYRIVGTAICRCTTTGWATRTPTCQRVSLGKCRRPGSVYYGSYRPYRSWYTAGSTVRYTCRSGYTLSGRANLTCSSNGTWSYRRPSCVRVVHKCPVISAPTNGSIKPVISRPASVGTRVWFKCGSGYTRNGADDIICRRGGVWSASVPTCERKCSRPDSVRYASFRPYSRSYAVSATVTYTCRSGYSLSGQSVLTCGADGEWSHDEPTCARVVVKCPAIGAPDNGSIRPTISQQANVGTRVLFTCNDGFRRNGSRDSRCQSNGRWSSSVPTCEPIQCAAPGNVDNGSFEPGTGPYGVSNTVTYTCSDNYVLEGQVVLTCLVSGEWSHDEPTCNPIQCAAPGNVDNGSFEPGTGPYVVSNTVTYTCSDNYVLEGQAVLTCLVSGEWSHDEPQCLKTCPIPVEPINGGVTPVQEQYPVNFVIWYTCDTGYTTADRKDAICRPDGTWSDDAPNCVAITCNRPDEIAFGSLTTAGDNFEIGETVTYICNDGHEIVGQDVLTCTNTGEWSHDEPTCTRIIQCATPDEPLNGGFSPNQPAYDITEVVTFTCANGFILNGQSQITCQDTGLWSDDEPTCDAITCNRPDEIAFGSLTTAGDNFEIGETVTYVCNDGYEIVGQDVLTCTVTGEWSHDEPTCTRIIQCATPDEPLNGGFSPNQPAYDITDVVTFTCADGFILNGQSQITCQDTGLWSDDEPICDAITCNRPDEIAFGSLTTAGDNFEIGETVTYVCNDGYEIVGQDVLTCTSQITCEDTGLWSDDEPTCDAITCNRPDEIAFGSLTTAGDNFEIGETVTYTCNDGYEIAGQDVLTCTVTGEWSHDEPTCTRIIQCATPDEPLNGGFSPNQLAYDITDVVTFTCADGFILNGQSQITCEDTGLWSDDEPTCDPITCNRPDEIAFGSLTTAGDNFEIGETVTYVCNDGYEIVGQDVLTCTVTGEWSHDEPTCTRIIQCATPDEPLNGGFSPNQPAYDITEVVTFTCADGFILNGQSQITCQDTGLWSDDEPICDAITCNRPDEIAFGSLTTAGERFEIDETVTYICNDGYEIVGQNVLTCTVTGEWSHDEPTCTRIIQCATPDEPLNGGFSPNQPAYDITEVVTFTCANGFILNGQSQITCEDTGLWSDDEPTCDAITCNRPDEIAFGSLTTAGESFEIGETVTYICNDGYEIVGQNVLTCTVTGEWSHDEPTCTRIIQCATPDEPLNGGFSPNQPAYDITEVVTFTCADGFILNGQSQITCEDTGVWSDDEPTCDPIQCAAPGNVDNGSFEPGTGPYSVSDTVTYTCSGNYVLEGQAVLTCQINGDWSHDEPTCNPIQCATPGDVSNGSFEPDTGPYVVSNTVTYTCSGDYVLEGQAVLTCLVSGEWSHDEPQCVGRYKLTCPIPVEPINGGVTPVQEQYPVNFVIWYTCDTGYTTADRKDAICRPDGTWSDDAPNCVAITCNRPDEISYGSLTTAGNSFEIGETVTYVCNDGYEIVGQGVLTCTNTGEWSHDEPTCQRVIVPQCASRVSPANGAVSPVQASYDANSEVTFTCTTGYRLVGSSSSTCLSTGLWDTEVPSC
uniref:Sushi domain-containing protein n=1 Tax=Ciona savignyi TaxID=51511 RepID=H2Y5C1_CIOSA